MNVDEYKKKLKEKIEGMIPSDSSGGAIIYLDQWSVMLDYNSKEYFDESMAYENERGSGADKYVAATNFYIAAK